ncbi:type VII secretion protein EccB, Actinobacterial [Mycobacteroides abscessus subsp. bolletii]|uniref:type VII secretion protein EccB n=1 Tax=Mycobacteroides abscessus TaxID=36809 RepID=UPI0009A7AA40|nr:type VII secretion protein EccB [Mycobacteroides abscessus]SKU95185.1 type VII secretion protein EccB, Actinobacterial [Mycobacteroides abscessus subsp. bolletii]
MARRVIRAVQLSGYRWLVRRIEQGMMRADIWGNQSPWSAATLAFGVGLIFACLIPVAAMGKSYFSHRADRVDAEMIMPKGGGLYVMYDDGRGRGPLLRPATNVASARLIIGRPDAPKVVKDETLAEEPRGPLTGIPSGPNNLATRTDDTAKWTVCDKHTGASDLSLTKTEALSTTLFAGTDSLTDAVAPLAANDAVLVKLDGDNSGQQWIVYKGRRASVGAQDMASRQAMGLTPAAAGKAIPITPALFNAIPVAPALSAPFIADRGRVNPVLPEALNGDVIVAVSADGTRQYWVALNAGVQQVSELVAQLLLNTGSKEVTTITRSALSAAPLVSDIDTSRYPDRAPTFREPHVLCWTWTKGINDQRATADILIGESLPAAPEDIRKIATLLPTDPREVTANAAYTKPGSGWYVRVTGAAPDSHAQESLMFIEDTGIRYLIGPDDQNKYESTIQALGIGGKPPLPIPWPIAKLYGPGSTLSIAAAHTEHGRLPDDVYQKSIPPPTNSKDKPAEAPPEPAN